MEKITRTYDAEVRIRTMAERYGAPDFHFFDDGNLGGFVCHARVAVETEGPLTHGATIAELRLNRPRSNANAHVWVGVDVVLRAFYERILRRP